MLSNYIYIMMLMNCEAVAGVCSQGQPAKDYDGVNRGAWFSARHDNLVEQHAVNSCRSSLGCHVEVDLQIESLSRMRTVPPQNPITNPTRERM